MALNVVIGPPAAGKSTYIRENKTPGDIVVDYDAIAVALSGTDSDNHTHTDITKKVTKAARDAAIREARKHTDTVDVWLIHGSPQQSTLDRYKREGAKVHTIDPGKQVVMHRIKTERPHHMLAIAGAWYDQHDKQPGQAKPKQAHQRGYDWNHRHNRQRLLYNHTDGTPCQWCGKPMYKTPAQNFDGAPLEADHTQDIKHHGQSKADRLLHRHCNRSRKDGQDHRSPLHQNQTDQHDTGKPIKWDWLG